MNKHIILVTLILFCATSSQAQNHPGNPRTGGNNTEAPHRRLPGPADFGIYKIEPNTSQNGMLKSELPLVTRGTRVRSQVTGKKALVTGDLIVLTSPGYDLAGRARALGLTIKPSHQEYGLHVLEAPDGADLMSLKAALEAEVDVRQVNIDVQDNRYVPN